MVLVGGSLRPGLLPLLPIVFQGFWLRVPLILPESALFSHVLCWLPRLRWARVGGPVVIEDTPGVSLTVSPLLRNGIGITEWSAIHPYPAAQSSRTWDKCIGQGRCPPQSTPPPMEPPFAFVCKCNINFLSFGLLQMQKVWHHIRQDWFRGALTIRLHATQRIFIQKLILA